MLVFSFKNNKKTRFYFLRIHSGPESARCSEAFASAVSAGRPAQPVGKTERQLRSRQFEYETPSHSAKVTIKFSNLVFFNFLLYFATSGQ